MHLLRNLITFTQDLNKTGVLLAIKEETAVRELTAVPTQEVHTLPLPVGFAFNDGDHCLEFPGDEGVWYNDWPALKIIWGREACLDSHFGSNHLLSLVCLQIGTHLSSFFKYLLGICFSIPPRLTDSLMHPALTRVVGERTFCRARTAHPPSLPAGRDMPPCSVRECGLFLGSPSNSKK